MCDPGTIGLIVSAVSGGVAAKNNNDALKRQDDQAAAGIIKNQANQKDANDLVNQQVDAIAGNTGESERAAALNDYQGAARDAQGASGDASVVGASNRFDDRQASAAGDVRTAGEAQAENLSVIDGILRQRINEGVNVGDTKLGIQETQSRVGAEDYLTRLRVNSEQPNQVVAGLAGVGSGIGAGMSQMGPTKVNAAGPAIIGQGGTSIGGSGAVNPYTSSNPWANVKMPSAFGGP